MVTHAPRNWATHRAGWSGVALAARRSGRMSECMGDPHTHGGALTKNTTGLALLELLPVAPLLASCASTAGEPCFSASPVRLATAGPVPSGM